jgi:hypothetical protein
MAADADGPAAPASRQGLHPAKQRRVVDGHAATRRSLSHLAPPTTPALDFATEPP